MVFQPVFRIRSALPCSRAGAAARMRKQARLFGTLFARLPSSHPPKARTPAGQVWERASLDSCDFMRAARFG